MKIEKTYFQTSRTGAHGEQVHLAMPLTKIDKQNRIVSGFATLDNEDVHKDIVTADASRRAFERFRGNVRLMHQPIPAGKVVDFSETEFYDPKTEKMYRGVFVNAYISKGAPEIWEMVLDGTLTGFSIGGDVLDAESQLVKDANGDGKTVRFIKDYELTELSLVDNPANQMANIMSIKKLADGATEITGIMTKANTENVFYCNEHEIAVASTEETQKCNHCNKTMENIGWFENDDESRVAKINKVITSASHKGGAKKNMPNEEKKELAHGTHEEEAVVVNNASIEDIDVQYDPTKEEEAVAENNPEVVDVQTEELTLEKMISGLAESLEKLNTSLETTSGDHTAKLAGLDERITAFEAKLNEFATSSETFTQKFAGLKTNVESLEKRLGDFVSETAVRKSAELGGSTEKLEKSDTTQKSNIWAGSPFSLSDL